MSCLKSCFLVVFIFSSYITLYSQVDLNKGLIAHYTFNGNANDESGNGNNGTLMNGTGFAPDRFGRANQAASFDGIDDYILVNDEGKLSTPQITVVAIVFPEEARAQSIVGKIQKTNGYQGTYHLGVNYDVQAGFFWGLSPNKYSCNQQVPYIPSNPFITSPDYFSVNAWHCVVGTYGDGIQKLYVDGILVDTKNYGLADLQYCTNTNLLIGQWWDDDKIPFKGKIDEVRIYNRVVNQDEVTAFCGNECSGWLGINTADGACQIGDLDITGSKLTVEATFNRTDTYLAPGLNFAGDLVSKHSNNSDCNYLLQPNYAAIATSNGYFKTPDICDIELNKSYHVALTYDGNTLKFYRNGFLMSSIPATGTLKTNDYQTAIGNIALQPANNNIGFLGFINEVRIWNTVRTQAQLKSNLNTSLSDPPSQVGLQAYYIFDNLLNKQGNNAWNGTLINGSSINQTNPVCSGYVVDSCKIIQEKIVIPSFTAPTSVCINEPIQVANTSTGASSYYWSFCAADINKTPEGVNLGSLGNAFTSPVYSDIVNVDGNYYVFISNNHPSKLVRLDYGNSLLNTPVAVDLGDMGVMPDNLEGLQVVYNSGRYYAIIVGGDNQGGGRSSILKVDIGPDIKNNNPVGTDWGNLGDLTYPHALYMFNEGGIWYGFTMNYYNSTMTRFVFGTNFNSPPVATNMGVIGEFAHPVSFYAVNEGGKYYAFVPNAASTTLTRLDFGNSLVNTPTGTNLGNISGTLHTPWDIYIVKYCGETKGFIINGDQSFNDIVRLDFPANDITQTPSATSLGNIGELYFPHSFSKLFREGADMYSFITNAYTNTLSRIKFPGCTSASIAGSTAFNPPPFSYSQPGIYNVSLSVDDGLPTQSVFCKQIEVKQCITAGFTSTDTVCVNTPVTITNTSVGATTYNWSFCKADINSSSAEITNITSIPDVAGMGSTISLVEDGGVYYGFYVTNTGGSLIKIKFGGSYNNIPVTTDLGTLGGVLNKDMILSGIQVVKNENKWYAIITAGSSATAYSARLLKVEFGASLDNANPVATNWGNIGDLVRPGDIKLVKEKGQWIGFVVNPEANALSRIEFSASFNATPTGINLGSFTNQLSFPSGIDLLQSNYKWYAYITNKNSNKISRLDFGASLLNTPVFHDIGDLLGSARQPQSISMYQSCESIVGLVTNGQSGQIVKFNFDGDPTSNYGITYINQTLINNPYGISAIKQTGNDLFTFVRNGDNSINRIKFPGCTSASIATSIKQKPDIISYNAPGIYTINLITDKGTDNESVACQKVVVKDKPTPHANLDTAFCAGNNITFTSLYSSDSYQWSTTETTNEINIKDGGKYWVTTNQYGCFSTDSFMAVKNELPKVFIGNDTTLCQKDSIIVKASNTNSKFLWKNGSQLDSLIIKAGGIYYVDVTDVNTCKGSDTVNVKQGLLPLLSGVNDQKICAGDVAQISVSSSGINDVFNWYPDATLSNTSIFNPQATPNDTTMYYFGVTNSDGCITKDSLLVNVLLRPQALTRADTSLCKGDAVLLATQYANASTYTWLPPAGLDQNSTQQPMATPAVTTKYTVTAGNGVCSVSDNVVVTVMPLPDVGAGADTTVCGLANVQLTATGANNYTWFPTKALSNSGIQNPVAQPAATTMYHVKGTDGNGCFKEDSIQINVLPVPVFAINPKQTQVCLGDSILVTASGGDVYNWIASPDIASPYNSQTFITPAINSTYLVSITNTVCKLTEQLSTVFSVLYGPTISVASTNDINCTVNATTLTASGGVRYNWTPAVYLTSNTASAPVAKPQETTMYHLKAWGTNGCTTQDSILVKVIAANEDNAYRMPSAFTPNNDGNNDCFGMKKWSVVYKIDFAVYDRWGMLLFRTNNPNDCWDGNYKGSPQAPGTYVYQIKASTLCGEIYRKGTVVLIR